MYLQNMMYYYRLKYPAAYKVVQISLTCYDIKMLLVNASVLIIQ